MFATDGNLFDGERVRWNLALASFARPILKSTVVIALVCIASAYGVAEELRSEHQDSEDGRELVSDAAIIVPIIGASVGAYKGKPCAYPSAPCATVDERPVIRSLTLN